MNSRERMLAATRRQPVDHPPLYLRLWDMHDGQDNFPFKWRDPVCRAEYLQMLGVDDTLLLEPPLGYTEEYHAEQAHGVTAVVRDLPPAEPGGRPLLNKLYQTPNGPLSITVKISADWIHGHDIMLFSDYNLPRQTESIVKDVDDIPRLKYLLAPPTAEQIKEFRMRSRVLHAEANRLGVAIDGGWTALGDSAVWLCGINNVYKWQMRRPDLLDALFDTLLEWELLRTDLVLDEGVDMMVHMAWYEGTTFWTPNSFRRFIKPRLAQIIQKCHARGVPVRYIITKEWRPIQEDLFEVGVDCIQGVDPVQDKIDLREVKKDIGQRMSLMGGLNAAVTVGQGSEEQVRSAIDEAMEILSPGSGFVLFPVDNLFCSMPWERVQIVIDQYQKYC